MGTNSKTNEADLEARIDAILKIAFPTFQQVGVKHQPTFTFRFGHHEVLVDHSVPKPYSKAIADVLLTIDGRNTILLELKRDGKALAQADIDQGISYARLIEPMPPITLISNSSDNWFFETFTKQPLSGPELNVATIQKITDSALRLAAGDVTDAIKLLLNNDPLAIASVINATSRIKLGHLIGSITEIDKHICTDFLIPRQIIADIENSLSKSHNTIGIVGPAFSGKTNVLYQWFEKADKEGAYCFYFDCHDQNYSILQQIGNAFTEATKSFVSKDKVREWLISAANNSDTPFYLLIDNFNGDISSEIKAEIIELIDLFKGAHQSVIYTIDEYNYERIGFLENRRYKTIIGNQSHLLKLDELNDKEYQAAQGQLFTSFRIGVQHGGHFAPEYRQVRLLRLLAGEYSNNASSNPKHSLRFPAVPDWEQLKKSTTNKFYTKDIIALYRKLATCFILESIERDRNPTLHIAAAGSGAVSKSFFEQQFPLELTPLLTASIAVSRELPGNLTILYPKLPEVMAFHLADIICEAIMKGKEMGQTIIELCQLLIKLTGIVPFCDIVGASVLLKIGYRKEVELFSDMVQQLLNIPPHLEPIAAGTTIMMYLEDVGPVQIHFKDGGLEDDGFISDYLPYAILSQLAGYPLLMESKDYHEYAFHNYLLYTIGSNPHFLRRADPQGLKSIRSHDGYDFDGIGHMVSSKEGIIEPIVQSIQECFMHIPQEIEHVYEKAFEEDNILLLWRVFLALQEMVDIVDLNLAQKAADYDKRFRSYFNDFMARFLARRIEDEDEKEAFLKQMREMNDEMPL